MTSDPKEKVAEFFKTEFPKMGWTDMSAPIDATASSIQLIFSKGTAVTMISISGSSEKTLVTISKVGG